MQINNINQVDISTLNKTVTLIVPAKNAKLGPPVGPILGQVKIKVKDFCTLFNESTKKYQDDFPIKTYVFVYKSEKFNFLINAPSVSFLLKNLKARNETNNLNIIDLYKIMLIKKTDNKGVSDRLLFRNILYITKTLGIKIK